MAGNRDLWIRIGARVDGFMAGIAKAEAGLKGFDKELQKSAEKRQALDQIGTQLGLVGAAATAATFLVGKAAMDWETAWAGVTKTVDGTDAQMAALEGQLRNLATTLPATHQEIAAVAEAAGQLGVAREDITAFTRTMIDLGETTNLTADEAATSIAQLMNVMQTAPADVDNLGSALVALGNDGASTERDIIQMAQNLAGAGATVGLAEADVLALANALASVGIEAEAGGSSVSKILIDMAKAAATGSPELERWASTAGMAADEFGALVQSDPAQAFDAFTKGLGRINTEGGDVFTLLENLGQSDVRVTRALLGMANAGDLLADSLALGGSAWQENSALADEAAKRYDTSAAKMQVAWNNVKDNMIDAGEGILPVVEALSEVVVGLTDAFGSLPGPAKAALGLLTGAVGVTALAAGGFLKLYGTISDTRAAFQTLSIDAPKLAGGLKTAAQAGGILAAAFVGVNTAFELLDRDSAPTVESLTKSILDLSDGAKSLNAELSNSRGLMTMIAGTSQLEATIKEAWKGTDGLTAAFSKAFSLGGMTSALNPYGDALEDIQAYDRALSSLVTSGATEQAATGHAEFAAAARDAGLETDEIARLLPEYTASLQNVDNQARIAADGTSELAGATTMLTDEQQAAQDAARATAEGFMAFSSSLDDSSVSLSQWIDELAAQAKALREFQHNAQTAAKRGLDDGLIKSLETAGPAGARRMAQLADASDRELKRANRAWRSGEQAVDRFVDATGKVPPQKSTTIKVLTEGEQRLRDLRGLIDGINGKTVRVVVDGRTTGGGITKADGGIVDYYANGGLRENHVAEIAPAGSWRVWAEPETGGEAYIPLHPSKRSRSIDIWAETGRRLGMESFADGGFSGEVMASFPNGVARQIGAEVRRALDGATLRDDRGRSIRLQTQGA